MKRFTLMIMLLLTLRLYDGTTICFGHRWTARVISNVLVLTTSLSDLHGSAAYQAYRLDDVDYLSDGKDVVIKHGNFISTNPGRWMESGE